MGMVSLQILIHTTFEHSNPVTHLFLLQKVALLPQITVCKINTVITSNNTRHFGAPVSNQYL